MTATAKQARIEAFTKFLATQENPWFVLDLDAAEIDGTDVTELRKLARDAEGNVATIPRKGGVMTYLRQTFGLTSGQLADLGVKSRYNDPNVVLTQNASAFIAAVDTYRKSRRGGKGVARGRFRDILARLESDAGVMKNLALALPTDLVDFILANPRLARNFVAQSVSALNKQNRAKAEAAEVEAVAEESEAA